MRLEAGLTDPGLREARPAGLEARADDCSFPPS